jgi:hypothetical protein
VVLGAPSLQMQTARARGGAGRSNHILAEPTLSEPDAHAQNVPIFSSLKTAPSADELHKLRPKSVVLQCYGRSFVERLLMANWTRSSAVLGPIGMINVALDLPHLRRGMKQEMRAQSALLGQQRCEAYMDLMELVELTEMPPKYMGWA